jgi:hypothetical protein
MEMTTKCTRVALWASTVTVLCLQAAAAVEPSGAKPGDDALTCEQIASEFMPYMQQITPAAMAAGQTAQEVRQRGQQHVAEETPAAVAMTAAAMASSADPTGAASRAVGQAEIVHQRELWERYKAQDRPLNDKYMAQTAQLAAQAQRMQADPRLQRLMQLAQEKNCDKR